MMVLFLNQVSWLYLVVRTMSDDLLLGVLESCCGNRGPFSFGVFQEEVGTHILPTYLSSATAIDL